MAAPSTLPSVRLPPPTTPKRPKKRRSGAPPLQRAGHASLTFESPPDFSTLSSGLLYSPFDDHSADSSSAVISQTTLEKSKNSSQKLNRYSFANVFGSRFRHHLQERRWQRHTASPNQNIAIPDQTGTIMSSKPPSMKAHQEQQFSFHSLGTGLAAGRSGASSRQSRRSELSDTSKTLLALFPLPPKLVAPSPGGSSSQGTPNEPKTPDMLFQFGQATLPIEMDDMNQHHHTPTPGVSIKPTITRTYSLPKPPPRPKKVPVATTSANDITGAHVTPPRAIFADYATAFQSIRSKSARDLNVAPQLNVDLPLPPVPALLVDSPERQPKRAVSVLNQRAKSLARSLSAKHHAALAKSSYSTQILAKRVRSGLQPAKTLARFSMPAAVTSNRTIIDEDDDVLLLSSSSSPRGDSTSSPPSFRGSDEGSHSTHPESNDPAERLIDSYVRKDDHRAVIEFRRYSALPRLQTTRSARVTDDTVSTIGDLLSQYGDPEYRSLPTSVSQTSISQRLQANEQEHNQQKMCNVDAAHTDVVPVVITEGASHPSNNDVDNPFKDEDHQVQDDEVIIIPQPVMLAQHIERHDNVANAHTFTFLESSAPLTDYGDTRELLQLSSSSIDIGRTLDHERLSANRSTSSEGSLLDADGVLQDHTSSDGLLVPEVSSCINLTPHMDHFEPALAQTLQPERSKPSLILSDRASEAVATSDNASTKLHPEIAAVRKQDLNPFRKPVTATTILPIKSSCAAQSDQLSQYFAEQNLVSGLMSNIYSKYPMTAAFGAKDVQPGILRFSPSTEPGRSSLRSPLQEITIHDNLAQSSTLSEDDGDEDNDWETVAESHRTTHAPASVANSDSFEHHYNTSLSNTSTRIGFHPADQRFKHTYRLHSPPRSAEPVLLPAYDFGSSGFPYNNASSALTSSRYLSQPQAGATPDNVNPFIGLPSQTLFPPSAFSQRSLESVSFDEEDIDDRAVPYGVWRGPNLSVVYEQSGERSSTSEVNEILGALPPPSVIGTVSRLEDDLDSSSAWVSCDPGQEVSSTGDGSAWQHTGTRLGARTRSMILASGADASLIKTLRKDDERMASSPLSDTNSFAKVSRLGPHANITGSINGTNMRYVGSSLVGTSSPIVSPKSVGSSIQHTPHRLEAPLPAHETSSSLFEEQSTPALRSDIRRPTSYQIPKEKRSMLLPQARPSSNHTVQLLSPTKVDEHFSCRPSHSNRETLNRLNLGDGHLSEVNSGTLQPREPFQRIASQRRDLLTPKSPTSSIRNAHTPHTLLPRPQEGIWSPHLHRPDRPPSSQISDVRSLKEKLSWLAFAICLFFPPLLIFFGHGLFDGLMWTVSKRRVEHFGRRQKVIGKVIGYFVTGGVCLGLGIALIVIHTVPNNLPR